MDLQTYVGSTALTSIPMKAGTKSGSSAKPVVLGSMNRELRPKIAGTLHVIYRNNYVGAYLPHSVYKASNFKTFKSTFTYQFI